MKLGRSVRTFAHALLVLAASATAVHADLGTWADGPAMSLRRQETGAARIGNAVYVVGGLLQTFPPTTPTDTVEVLDLLTGQWSFAPPMPQALDHAAVAVVGGKLYVIGGYAGDFVARTEVYVLDPGTGQWSSAASLPAPRGAASAVTVGGRVYVFGGTGAAGQATNTSFEYDPAANVWRQRAAMPTAREHLTAAVAGGRAYVVGGRAGGVSKAANERYDPASNTWTVLAPMPTARSAMGTAALFGRIYAAGGETPVLHAVTESYDPARNRWTTLAPMRLPRHGVAAVALDDRILMPGGGIVQGLGPVRAVDAFVPPAVPSASLRNGSGCNPTGFAEVASAVIGDLWETTVDLAGASASVVGVVGTGPLTLKTALGELLVDPSAGFLGGLSLAAGAHALPIPSDCGLVGAAVWAQAATLSPGDVRLQNALDVTIGAP